MNEINWNKITVKQYFSLQERLTGIEGTERLFKAGCILHKLNEEQERKKGLMRFRAICESVAFLAGTNAEPNPEAKIGGRVFFFKPIHFVSGGEFLDIQSILATDKELSDKTIDIFARLCAEHELTGLHSTEGDKYEPIVDKWRNHVLNIDMATFWSLYAFFLTNTKDLPKVILPSLVKNLNRETKAQIRELSEPRRHLKGYTGFLGGLRKIIRLAYLRNLRNLLALRFSNIKLSWRKN